MKKISFIVFLLLFASKLIYSQSNSPEVISTTGNYFENENASLSFTIGEPIIETLSGSDLIITQGFQQSKYEITPVIDILGDDIFVKVYPNPTSQFIIIDIGQNNAEKYSLDIINIKGERLFNTRIGNEKTILNLDKYSLSELILRIFNDKNKMIKSFKIIKI